MPIATKLWVNDTFMIPLRNMVDDPNHHQTWPPPLLKIENLTKNSEKSYKGPIATKLWGNDTFMIPFKNYS